MNETDVQRLLQDDEGLPSDRRRLIKESIMHTITHEREELTNRTLVHPHRRQPSRRILSYAAAALLLVVGLVVTNFGSNTGSAAEAAVVSAANATGSVETLRFSVERLYTDGTSDRYDGYVDGVDVYQELRYLAADGSDRGEPFTMTVIGDTVWSQSADGQVTSQALGADEHLALFAEANEAVITAAVKSARVETVIVTPEATRYVITPTDEAKAKLRDLGPAVLAWFDLENPDQIRTLEVVVTNGLITEVVVDGGGGISGSGGTVSQSTSRYSDFDAELSVTPPR